MVPAAKSADYRASCNCQPIPRGGTGWEWLELFGIKPDCATTLFYYVAFAIRRAAETLFPRWELSPPPPPPSLYHSILRSSKSYSTSRPSLPSFVNNDRLPVYWSPRKSQMSNTASLHLVDILSLEHFLQTHVHLAVP